MKEKFFKLRFHFVGDEDAFYAELSGERVQSILDAMYSEQAPHFIEVIQGHFINMRNVTYITKTEFYL